MDATHFMIVAFSVVFFCVVSCNSYVISSSKINGQTDDTALSNERVRRFIESEEFINRPRPGRRELFEESEAVPPRLGKREISDDEINDVMTNLKREAVRDFLEDILWS